MSSIAIDLAPETERKLRDKAGSAGLSLEAYLRRLAEYDANGSGPRSATFDRILAPVREGFAQGGMSDDELAKELEAAREEAWQERQARNPSP